MNYIKTGTGARMTQFIPHAQFVEYKGAPHGLFMPEKDCLNRDLLAFANDSAVGQ